MKASHRSFWLRQLHQWHWISAALSLIGMLAFSVTGITLNHAGDISTKPKVTMLEGKAPEALLAGLHMPDEGENHPLPEALRSWLSEEMSLQVGNDAAEWSEDEIYLSMEGPGGGSWLSIDRSTGDVMYEATFRGWVSYFNDLHKGRDTGTAWRWFIDVFAAACVIFCVTGLIIMQFHAERRPATWPLVGFGFIAPLLLALLFIH